jgi:hypothetical protein
LKKAKIPFPEFPFDVLVDNPSVHHATLKGAGFGNRWLGSGGSTDTILKGLKLFFSISQPPVSEAVRRWLDVLSF